MNVIESVPLINVKFLFRSLKRFITIEMNPSMPIRLVQQYFSAILKTDLSNKNMLFICNKQFLDTKEPISKNFTTINQYFRSDNYLEIEVEILSKNEINDEN